MIKTQSNCQQCGQPCLKDNCPNYRVKTLICDKCEDEVYIFVLCTPKWQGSLY